MGFLVGRCKTIFGVVSFFVFAIEALALGPSQMLYFGMAAEGTRGSYLGNKSDSFMNDQRSDFYGELQGLFYNEKRKAQIQHLYQSIFGRNRDEIHVPECLKQIDSREVLPRVHLNYEVHQEENAEAYLAKNARFALEGKAMLLMESDFPTQGASEFERPLHSKGLVRSQERMGIGSVPPEKRFLISGIDHPGLRAAGILLSVTQDLWHSRRQQNVDESFRRLLTETFRNSSLRQALNKLIANPKSSGKMATLFQSFLQNLDRNPIWKIDQLSLPKEDHEAFTKFVGDLTNQFIELNPSMKGTNYAIQFDLRDEHMTQKILEKICQARKWNISDIHVSIGALHLDGIGMRLQKISKQLGLKLEVQQKNAMLPKEIEKPFLHISEEGPSAEQIENALKSLDISESIKSEFRKILGGKK